MSRRGENIHKRKDGRWEGRFIEKYNENGKAIYKSVYARTYMDVKHKLMEINSSNFKNHTPSIINPTLTLKDILYLWLENNRIKLKIQSYSNYLYVINKHIVPNIGHIYINNINATYINSFLMDKYIIGRIDNKGGLAPSYIRKIVFIITSALKYATEENYCNHVNGKIISLPKAKKELKVLSINEQITLENYLLNNTSNCGLGVLMSLYTGLRVGEICGLCWEDIDFETNSIHVHRTVERIRLTDAKENTRKTKLVLCDVKTVSSIRTIPIPSKLLYILRDKKENNDSFIIEGKVNKYADPRTLQYYFQNCLLNCQIKHINFHILRHTFATRCIESGMDVKSLSEILGHSNVNITLNTYVHSSLEHKRTQIEKMSIFCGQ